MHGVASRSVAAAKGEEAVDAGAGTKGADGAGRPDRTDKRVERRRAHSGGRHLLAGGGRLGRVGGGWGRVGWGGPCLPLPLSARALNGTQRAGWGCCSLAGRLAQRREGW